MDTNTYSISSGKAQVMAQAFITQVYTWMTFGLAVTGFVSWYAARSERVMQMLFGRSFVPFFILVAIELGLVFFLSARVGRMSSTTASGCFVLYSAVSGLTLAPVFLVFTGESIASAFFITAGTFGAMSAYGYLTKRDLTGMGSFLMMGLIGIIIASLVNIFLKNPTVMWVITYITVIIFVGLTAFDTQKIKQMAFGLSGDEEVRSSVAVLGALTLSLDFINLFLAILRITGRQR